MRPGFVLLSVSCSGAVAACFIVFSFCCRSEPRPPSAQCSVVNPLLIHFFWHCWPHRLDYQSLARVWVRDFRFPPQDFVRHQIFQDDFCCSSAGCVLVLCNGPVGSAPFSYMQNFALALVKQFPLCSTLTSSKYLNYVWIGVGEDPVLFLSHRFERLKVF
jgi:hypothetical protein